MEATRVQIRPADVSDVAALSVLCGQLGYERTEEEVERLLCEFAADPDHEILVARNVKGVVGWIEVTDQSTLTSGREAMICGLVVEEGLRGHRIGEQLVEAAENWARARGMSAVRVRSRDTREHAHRFYTRLGYELYKKQFVFRKTI